MRKGFLVASLLVVSAVVASDAPGAVNARRIASYCSPSGDVCYGIFKAGGTYSFRLTLAKKYFSRYRVCVLPLGQQAKCKSFPVKKTGASWGGTVVAVTGSARR